jgi:acetylornithine deacetylase
MASAHERVLASIDRLLPQYRELLQRLVRIPSPVGREGDAQALVATHMQQIGLDVRSFDVNPDAIRHLPGFNPTVVDYTGRPCVVGRATGSGGGRSLLLNAHIDTVPVEAAETWSHAPFTGAIENDRLYGRGACDDKAGVVECLLVAHAIKDAGLELAGDLTIASVIEDERSGNGTLATIEHGYVAEGVIIVDGTWPERFIVSHMGQVTFEIQIDGVPGHATSAGPNPVFAINAVLEAMKSFVADCNRACQSPWGDKTAPYFVNIGTVTGGVWPGSVPARCVIGGQFGFAPPDTCATAKAGIRDAIARAVSHSEWPATAIADVRFAGLETEPHIGVPSNPLVELLAKTISERHSATLRESVISGHCDLRHYASASQGATTASCLYGPGGGRNVHGTDEYFELAHLPIVAGNLACVALDWCGIANER